MRLLILAATSAAIAAALALPAAAQDTRTAKERSSRKWFDEQRVDNCRVPAELRGATPRPDCADKSPITAQGGLVPR